MDKNKLKSDVLQSLIDMMTEKETESLKSKSPKFMKLEVEATKLPEEENDEMEDYKRMKEIKGDVQDKHLDMADPMGKFKDPMKQMHMDEQEIEPKEEEDPDKLEQLLELYNKIK